MSSLPIALMMEKLNTDLKAMSVNAINNTIYIYTKRGWGGGFKNTNTIMENSKLPFRRKKLLIKGDVVTIHV